MFILVHMKNCPFAQSAATAGHLPPIILENLSGVDLYPKLVTIELFGLIVKRYWS